MSLWGKIKKAAKKIKNTIKKVVRVVKEIVHRVIGILDFLGSLLGIRPTKYIRVKVYILTDLKRRPVRDPVIVQQWVDEAKTILKDRLNVVMQAPDTRAGQGIVVTIPEPAPANAMFPNCGLGDAFSDAADYYEDHYTYVHTSAWNYIFDGLGYGEPIYVFVVADVAGDGTDGCSQPWLHNFAVLDSDLQKMTLPHEIGHLCSLAHKGKAGNLMNPNPANRDSGLTRWQISVFRNARYVTFFRP